MNRDFKGGLDNVIIAYNDGADSPRLQRCKNDGRSSLVWFFARGKLIRVIGRFGFERASVSTSDWLNGCAVLFISVGDVRIGNIRSTVGERQSTDATLVTGSLVFFDTFPRFCEYCAAEYTSSWSFCGTVCENQSEQRMLFSRCGLCVCKTMEGATLVDDREGITFDVELCVPWDGSRSCGRY